MKFKPLQDRIVVEQTQSEERTAGGVIIPDSAQEKPHEGKVIAAGPGARDDNGNLIALDVKKGDKVLYGKWSGTEISIGGKDYVIMKESDVLGILG
jgi:chaperonin GroES